MPPAGKSPQQRAEEALAQLEQQGGVTTLPLVLASRDVRPLMGRTWFGNALRFGVLPGVQIERGGVWRCERATFVRWLEEVRDGTIASMAVGDGSGAAAAGRIRNDEEVDPQRAGAEPAARQTHRGQHDGAVCGTMPPARKRRRS